MKFVLTEILLPVRSQPIDLDQLMTVPPVDQVNLSFHPVFELFDNDALYTTVNSDIVPFQVCLFFQFISEEYPKPFIQEARTAESTCNLSVVAAQNDQLPHLLG